MLQLLWVVWQAERSIRQWAKERKKERKKNDVSDQTMFLPTFIYTACREFLVRPLTHISRFTLYTGMFLGLWKISKTTPIPKDSIFIAVWNHRPIIILPVPAKIFETVLRQIYKQINAKISWQQDGFVERRSVKTNLVEYTNYLRAGWEDRGRFHSHWFPKSFDRVNHQILPYKLQHLEFADNLIALFSSYLTNRKQYV